MFLHLTADPLRRRRSTRPELQGVRAVAAALVLAFHADVPGLDGGFLGVDVFLVLSGYVVTTMLLAEHRRSGAIDLVAFTRARFSRLAPTAVVVALSTFVVALLAASPLARPQLVPEATAAVFGYENLLLAVRGVDYLQDDTVSAFRQFWSLGLEVQFYAVWPVVLVLALRFAERRGAIWVTGFGLVVSLASVPMARAVAEPFAFFMLPSRAWEFLAGALLAVGPAFAFAPRRHRGGACRRSAPRRRRCGPRRAGDRATRPADAPPGAGDHDPPAPGHLGSVRRGAASAQYTADGGAR
ncbi:acyltransferase [Curtobacterium sp. MCJR17_043]|uniref:acyltransferase family protein n=1 Tax=Curtobacterium sp. MCJR17_043 TaxID=2175660 RepID=UPI0024DFDBB6|nr:acyltransferase [Curtobacterium sp. MCJR17_043]WIB36414.1 acyltransferase [Curtobacterium sp. MCJR17_043]